MKIFLLITLALLLLFISACAPGTQRFSDENKPANLLHGVWHGWIAPITLIWQLFDPQVRIYEPNNSGWPYDFGFYIAIIGGFGGLALSRKRKGKC